MFRQMEKLIELLNEYEKKTRFFEDGEIKMEWSDNYENREYIDLYIISKKFGFIKWLVENEKIDLEKVKEKIGIPCFVWYTEGEISCVNDKEDYEQLLMLLSIQDEPINFLISILK